MVSDYDDLAPYYQQKELNLVVVDYRGYGASGGTPTFAKLIKDAHCLLKTVREELTKKGFPWPGQWAASPGRIKTGRFRKSSCLGRQVRHF
ncbi:MAG: hypothetical protein AB1652_09405 [Bacillota bacterium]